MFLFNWLSKGLFGWLDKGRPAGRSRWKHLKTRREIRSLNKRYLQEERARLGRPPEKPRIWKLIPAGVRAAMVGVGTFILTFSILVFAPPMGNWMSAPLLKWAGWTLGASALAFLLYKVSKNARVKSYASELPKKSGASVKRRLRIFRIQRRLVGRRLRLAGASLRSYAQSVVEKSKGFRSRLRKKAAPTPVPAPPVAPSPAPAATTAIAVPTPAALSTVVTASPATTAPATQPASATPSATQEEEQENWMGSAVAMSGWGLAASLFIVFSFLEIIEMGGVGWIAFVFIVIAALAFMLYKAVVTSKKRQWLMKAAALLAVAVLVGIYWPNKKAGTVMVTTSPPPTQTTAPAPQTASPAAPATTQAIQKEEVVFVPVEATPRVVTARMDKWTHTYRFPGGYTVSWNGMKPTSRYKMRTQTGKEYSFTPEKSDQVEGVIIEASFMALSDEPEEIYLTLNK